MKNIILNTSSLLANELHEAVNKNQFVLYFQPIVDIRTNKIQGIEALLRWKKDDGMVILPVEFIQALEQNNLITRVEEWVLRESCKQIKLCQELGLINISVNVSIHKLDMNLAALVEKIINEANIDPSTLVLELAGTMLMHDEEKSTHTLKALNKLGIKIAINDFGGDGSSFSSLQRADISHIKIDRSFIAGLPDNEISVAVVMAIIAMAHSLGIKVIAEAVETTAQINYLKEKKCDFYQGLYYSPPLSVNELVALIKNKKNEMSPQHAAIMDNQDPYQGFASCPDTQRAYLAQSAKNQAEWRQDSENIIDEFIVSIDKFTNFQEAYAFLADKRHRIAVNLKQRNEEGRTDYYGSFRNVGDHFRKIIHYGDGEQFWKWQKSKIFDLVYHLINPAKNMKIGNQTNGFIYENTHMGVTKENVSISNRPAVYYSVSVKSPYPDQMDKTLSIIELFEYEDERFNTIRIEYTPIEKEQLAKYYQIADGYYQTLLNWQQSDGVHAFFEAAARLAYLLAHLLLVKHGNVGITEWMLRAIAFRNGLYLGQFNYAEKISWDFKAVLTPDPEEYVAWFKQNLFQDYMLLNTISSARRFTFTRDQLQS